MFVVAIPEMRNLETLLHACMLRMETKGMWIKRANERKTIQRNQYRSHYKTLPPTITSKQPFSSPIKKKKSPIHSSPRIWRTLAPAKEEALEMGPAETSVRPLPKRRLPPLLLLRGRRRLHHLRLRRGKPLLRDGGTNDSIFELLSYHFSSLFEIRL